MALDQAALDLESLKIPQLHSKYLNFLMDERLVQRKAGADYSVLLRAQWEHSTGEM